MEKESSLSYKMQTFSIITSFVLAITSLISLFKGSFFYLFLSFFYALMGLLRLLVVSREKGIELDKLDDEKKIRRRERNSSIICGLLIFVFMGVFSSASIAMALKSDSNAMFDTYEWLIWIYVLNAVYKMSTTIYKSRSTNLKIDRYHLLLTRLDTISAYFTVLSIEATVLGRYATPLGSVLTTVIKLLSSIIVFVLIGYIAIKMIFLSKPAKEKIKSISKA